MSVTMAASEAGGMCANQVSRNCRNWSSSGKACSSLKERLSAVGHLDRIERPLPRMGAGKRGVSGRMPILGQDHMGKIPCQLVYHRDDRIATGHCQGAARAEIAR